MLITNWCKSNITKILCVLSFIFIILALTIIIKTPYANVYEISIYDVYPLTFWISIIIVLIIPFLALIFEEKKSSRLLFITIVAAGLCIFILLSLPAFRGYPLYGAGDTLTHLGFIKDISLNGYIDINDPYPIIHIFIYILSSILYIKSETITLYIPQIFLSLYILSIFLISRLMHCDIKSSLFITSCAIIPTLGFWTSVEYIMPSTAAFYTIPIFIYTIFKSKTSTVSLGYSIVSNLFILFFIFFHPENTLFLCIALFTIYLISKVYGKLWVNKKFGVINTLTSALLLFIGVLTWLSLKVAFGSTIKSIYYAFLLDLTPSTPPLVALQTNFSERLFNRLWLAFIGYGPALLYLVLGVIFLFLIIIYIIKRKKVSFYKVLFGSLFLAFILINILFLLKGTGIGYHIYRQLKYPIFISIFIIGIYYIMLRNNISKYKYLKVIFCLFIFAIAVVSPIIAVYNMYSSPLIQGFNYQVTNADISGMSYFFNHRDENKPILEPIYRAYQTRFADYLLGYKAFKSNIRYAYEINVLPPPHFGYDLYPNLGNYYSWSSYLLIYPPCEEYYTTIYPNQKDQWRYSPSDFERLKWDDTIDWNYDNGELKILIINEHQYVN